MTEELLRLLLGLFTIKIRHEQQSAGVQTGLLNALGAKTTLKSFDHRHSLSHFEKPQIAPASI
jgi:hypothetical protein